MGKVIVFGGDKLDIRSIDLTLKGYKRPLLVVPSFSQVGQDVWVCDKLVRPTFTTPGIYRGTFIDVGCNDPFYNSNTYGLELLGWHGMLIDINPEMCKMCHELRNNPVLHADAIKINWKSISRAHVDYLSLDIDGYSKDNNLVLKILQNLLPVVKFEVMTIEHDAYSVGNEVRDQIREYVIGQGYKLDVADVCCEPGKSFEDWWVCESL